MRTALINELLAQARVNPKIFLVVGDVGFSAVEPFAAEFPDRFLNAGIAEQNAIGVCAGLAAEGYHPWFFSIANFGTFRCLEQIRNDICYHNLPVTVVCVGAGFAYGTLGYSHHSVQDIGIMRTLPNLAILSPADPEDTAWCVKRLCHFPSPSYLRIGKAGEAKLFGRQGNEDDMVLARLGNFRNAVVCTGSILKNVMEAAGAVKDAPCVYSCSKLAPWTNETRDRLCRFEKILTVEEHVHAGGLASILREWDLPVRKSLHIPPHVLSMVGSQEYLRQQSGLDAESIADAIKNL